MKSRLPIIALVTLLGTAVNAEEDEALPPYFAPLVSGQGNEIEACYTAILARDGFDAPACKSTRWLFLFTQKKAGVATEDYQDEADFKEVVRKFTKKETKAGCTYKHSLKLSRLSTTSEPLLAQLEANLRMTEYPIAWRT